jgi:glycosyltransferase involved in cell wall biosynthesis
MKLLIFLPGKTHSGCENYGLTMGLEARKKFGWELVACFPNNKNTTMLQQHCDALNIEYVPLDINHEQEIEKGEKQPALHNNFLQQLKILHKTTPRVALIAIPDRHHGISTMLACASIRIPSLVTFYNYPNFATFDNEMLEAMEWCKKRRQKWVVPSNNNQHHLSLSLNMSADNISIINASPLNELSYYSSSTRYAPEKQEARKSVRTEFNLREDSFIVISTNRINEIKGMVDFMHIAPEILQSFTNIRFLVVGDGEMETEIKNWIKARGFEEQIIMTGRRNDVTRLLRASDLFMSASHETGAPTSLLEAMKEGLPAIVSDTAGHYEIVEEDKNAYIFKTKDANAFFETMKNALSDKEQLIKMGQNNLEKIKEFSQEKMINDTMDALQKISGYRHIEKTSEKNTDTKTEEKIA